MLASGLGLPISATHALIGAPVGTGLAADPTDADLSLLGSTFLLPLILGKLLAIDVAGTRCPLATGARRALGVKGESCVRVGSAWAPVTPLTGPALSITWCPPRA